MQEFINLNKKKEKIMIINYEKEGKINQYMKGRK